MDKYGHEDAIKIDITLDARQLNCPMPILKTKKTLASMADGQLLLVLTTDPDSLGDFALYTKQTCHDLLKAEKKYSG